MEVRPVLMEEEAWASSRVRANAKKAKKIRQRLASNCSILTGMPSEWPYVDIEGDRDSGRGGGGGGGGGGSGGGGGGLSGSSQSGGGGSGGGGSGGGGPGTVVVKKARLTKCLLGISKAVVAKDSGGSAAAALASAIAASRPRSASVEDSSGVGERLAVRCVFSVFEPAL